MQRCFSSTSSWKDNLHTRGSLPRPHSAVSHRVANFREWERFPTMVTYRDVLNILCTCASCLIALVLLPYCKVKPSTTGQKAHLYLFFLVQNKQNSNSIHPSIIQSIHRILSYLILYCLILSYIVLSYLILSYLTPRISASRVLLLLWALIYHD